MLETKTRKRGQKKVFECKITEKVLLTDPTIYYHTTTNSYPTTYSLHTLILEKGYEFQKTVK